MCVIIFGVWGGESLRRKTCCSTKKIGDRRIRELFSKTSTTCSGLLESPPGHKTGKGDKIWLFWVANYISR